jgi:3'-phosphoadenosine 5'-phosphosulfate sulfotransferase (PAPS reductase)/FAD synthetase
VQIGLSRLILESARALQGFSSDVPVVRHDSGPSSDAPAGERRAAVELRRRLRARVGDDCFGARIPPVIVELDDALLHGRRWAEAVARARERAQDAASACGRELPEVAPPPSESAR